MTHKDDLALARSLTQGDERQFQTFFDHYFPRLYRFALTRMGDGHYVEDIVQTTLINAMKNIHSYRGEAAMFTWLCQICRNEIKMYYRSNAKRQNEVAADDDEIRPILELLESDQSDTPDTVYTQDETRLLVSEILDFLPGNYGEVLEMKYIWGASVTEIAQKLELTELAVQSTLARARTAFRKALTQIAPHLGPASGVLS